MGSRLDIYGGVASHPYQFPSPLRLMIPFGHHHLVRTIINTVPDCFLFGLYAPRLHKKRLVSFLLQRDRRFLQ